MSSSFYMSLVYFAYLPLNSSFKISVITTLTILTTSPPRNAFHQTGSLIANPKPTARPMTLVNQNRNVLITRVNKPRVKIISGQVSIEINGRNSALTRPKISASHKIETRSLLRSMPGKMRTARYSAIALIAQRRINFVI